MPEELWDYTYRCEAPGVTFSKQTSETKRLGDRNDESGKAWFKELHLESTKIWTLQGTHLENTRHINKNKGRVRIHLDEVWEVQRSTSDGLAENEVELRNRIEGSGRHKMTSSLEIEWRLNHVICLVQQFEQEILNSHRSRTLRWGPISDCGEGIVLWTKSYLVVLIRALGWAQLCLE